MSRPFKSDHARPSPSTESLPDSGRRLHSFVNESAVGGPERARYLSKLIIAGAIGVALFGFVVVQPAAPQSPSPPTAEEIVDRLYACRSTDQIRLPIVSDGSAWIVRCNGVVYRFTPNDGAPPERKKWTRWNVKILGRDQ
jgi:hypothetical protein